MWSFVNIPLSGLYTIGVALRHMLYDQHVLPSFSVDVPTICVGNIAVGGTGKTPMVEYLLRLLTANGYHPAVLSRGYKRATRGFVMADSSSTAQDTATKRCRCIVSFRMYRLPYARVG